MSQHFVFLRVRRWAWIGLWVATQVLGSNAVIASTPAAGAGASENHPKVAAELGDLLTPNLDCASTTLAPLDCQARNGPVLAAPGAAGFIAPAKSNEVPATSGLTTLPPADLLAPAIVCNPGTKAACIVKTGTILANETWYSNTVYVFDILTIAAGVTVTVEPGTIIKGAVIGDSNPFSHGYLNVLGMLDLQGTSPNPVVFTSHRDDTYGGDNNGDGICPACATEPAFGDFLTVQFYDTSASTFDNAIVRYGYFGVRVYNDTTGDINPTVDNVTFSNNVYGLVFQTASTGDITSLVQNSRFTQNIYGLATYGASTGTARPTLTGNNFNTNTGFPIYLDGAGFPTYGSGNVFQTSNDHLGIALGGAFNSNGTWFQVNDQNGSPMPYVMYGDQISTVPNLACNSGPGGVSDTRIGAGSTITVPATLVIKFYVDVNCQRYLDVRGTLNLQSTSNANQVIFTSYRDDYGGDTNGDASATQSARGDWRSVTLYNSATTFDYAKVKYASYGLQVYNEQAGNDLDSSLSNSSGDDVAPLIANDQFEQNIFGVHLFAKYHGDVTSLITGTVFYSNTYGIGTGIYTGDSVMYSGFSKPTLTNNQFNNQSGFPIYLAGTGYPVYTGNTNTFSSNAQPAIALGGFFMNDGAWALVNGAPDVSGSLPYVVYQATTIGPTVCIDGNGQPVACSFVDKVLVPAGAVFKFYVDGDAPDLVGDTGLRTLMADVYGALDLQSTSGANQVVFTSYRDDIVDDTSGNSLSPLASDWGSLTLRGSQILFDEGGSPQVHFDYTLLQYASFGLQVYSIGAVNTNIFPEVDHNTFQNNVYGMYLFTSAAGDINSSIHDNLFTNNQYGLGAGTSATGVAFPALANNQFNNHSGFPIYLGGTAFPVYNQGNTFSSNSHLAIGLGGPFNRSGTLNPLTVTVGNPSTYMPYVVIYTDMSIASGATVSVPSGTVIKLDTTGCSLAGGAGCALLVYGELDLLGTASSPVVFTSYKDDSSGGDTNGDGGATSPSRTDWWGVYLYSSGIHSNYAFDYALVKYAEVGVVVVASGASNVFPAIAYSTFIENGKAIYLYSGSSGNVTSSIHHNLFSNNTTAVYAVKDPSATGSPRSTLNNNDLYGNPGSGNGMDIVSAGVVFTATQNWWGHCSGPYHDTLNASGQGVTVSNAAGSAVTLSPWQCDPVLGGITYSILGRVAKVGDTPQTPDPLAGVTMLLNTGVFTSTNSNGNYAFNGLPLGGTYTVQPFLSGYTFSPLTRTVSLQGDATAQNFTASPIVDTLYSASGRVLDKNGAPFPGVFVYTLASSTGASAGALTAANGYYTLTVPAGTYTLKALKTGYGFAPLTRQITVSGDLTGQDFQEAAITEIFLPVIIR